MLLTILVIVQIALLLSGQIFKLIGEDRSQITNIFQLEKISLLFFSAENISKQTLLIDAKNGNLGEDKEVDFLGDLIFFKGKAVQLPLDETLIKVQIVDLNRGFNLNNLSNESIELADEELPLDLLIFDKILLDQEVGSNQKLALSLADWLDKDSEELQFRGTSGAEDNTYRAKFDGPIYAKNGFIYDKSELSLVSGFADTVGFSAVSEASTKYYDLISKLVVDTTNPFGLFSLIPKQDAKINLNTADCDLLLSMFNAVSGSEVTVSKDVVCNHLNESNKAGSSLDFDEGEQQNDSQESTDEKQYLDSVDQLYANLKLSYEKVKWEEKIPKKLFSIKSDYFMMWFSADIQNCQISGTSLLHRVDNNSILTLDRKINTLLCTT